MAESLALASAKLHRAVLARQLYVLAGNPDQRIDHQLIRNLEREDADYLAAGGTPQGSARIVKAAEAEALRELTK